MKILVTGAGGFVGKNLTAALQNIKDGKDRTHRDILIDEIFKYDIGNSPKELESWCREADFVFNLAGVNRPKDDSEFLSGNLYFPSYMLETLKKFNNKATVMLSSSIQASLSGRFADSAYGKSKLECEKLFFEYSRQNGVKVLVYRFPNLFGKWCRPNYNSVIATFCHNIANDIPIKVNDPATELELLYIDDLVQEMLCALEGHEHRNEKNFCYVPVTHKVTLGEIVELLYSFKNLPASLLVPSIPENSFAKKLFSTYVSYLPPEKAIFSLRMNKDDRGSFTELLKTSNSGQFSVNISKPGITKGQHWHNSKWEFFIVVSGHALIQERNINSNDVIEFEVSGEKIEAVYMLPGYTHNIINLSDSEDLITIMWANEKFDPKAPDTFFEKV